jgi:transposase-like protein
MNWRPDRSKVRNHNTTFNAGVALEALKGERTVSELAASHGVHQTMIHQWKKPLLEGAADIFERGGRAAAPEIDEDIHLFGAPDIMNTAGVRVCSCCKSYNTGFTG